MNRCALAVAGVVLGAEMAFAAHASAGTFAELAALARSETAWFRPGASSDSQRFAGDFRAALDRLEAYLKGLGDKEQKQRRREPGWVRFLDQVRAAERDPERLLLISKCFYATQQGLEARPFLEARAAVDRYAQFRLLTGGKSEEQLRGEYVRRLEQVARLLESPQIDHEALGEQAAWFAVLGQAPRLLEGLRGAFGRPNLVVTVSQRMLPGLADRFQQGVSRSNWAVNTIVGRRVEGMTHFEGQVTGLLLRDQPDAVLELTLAGTVRAPQNTAYAGRFRIYSQGQTAVQAAKRLFWDGRRFAAQPARVAAAPDSTITGGDVERRRLLARGRIGDRVDNRLVHRAVERALRSQEQARREAASVTEQTIARQFDAAVRDRLAELNRDADYYYTNPLARVGMLPESRAVPAKSGISLQFHVRGLSALAAPAFPEETLSGDVNVYIHESGFPNLIQPFAGGGVWTDEFFARIQKEAVGDYSVEMRVREENERWSLTLDWMRPWSTRIAPDGIRFTLNASRFTIEAKHYEVPLVVKCTFASIREVGPAFGWQRVGDVEIECPAGLDPEAREFLHRKLSGFFLDRFFLDGLSAPAGGAWDTLSTVQLARQELADGWLRMEFRQTAPQE